MPLQKLQFRPGVNREGTTLANEGGWFECDKVRFRSGYPEKIGGWTVNSYTAFLGVCRSLWNWVTLRSFNLAGVGTNLKFYIESGGAYYDITPIKGGAPTNNTTTFAAVTTAPFSQTIIVTDTSASGLQVNDFVTFTGAASLGGAITAAVLNQEFQIQTIISGSEYTITVPVISTASDTGNGGGAVDSFYQINTGPAINTVGTGWGTSPWGGYIQGGVSTTLNGLLTSAATTVVAISTAGFKTTNGLLMVGDANQRMVLTSLPAQINNSVTTITVLSTFNFASSGFILIGTEIIEYTGKTATTFTGCTRASSGTSAATQNKGSVVYQNVLEDMSYATVTGTDFNTVTRGADGTVDLSYAIPKTFASGNLVFRADEFPGWGQGYASAGITLQLRLWSQSNYGEDLLFNPRGGALYLWQPLSAATPAYTTRGTVISGTDVPAYINQIMVSDATRITIAFGCNDYGSYASTTLDPLLIRWTAQEDFNDWTPTTANQAGSYRLSHGSSIIAALQTRQEILVWTDSAIYAMQYLGAPFVWGFTLLADNLSIASPNVTATANGVTYWMGTDKFYVYSGRVETLPCSLRQYVFQDINRGQQQQFFAGTNEGYSEIWWFYCSVTGPDGTGTLSNPNTTIDRYVIFNYLDRVWYYGTMNRTAWLDSPLRQFPMAATTNPNYLVYHESAVDDNITNPPTAISAYIQSSDFDIGDGHNYGFVWRVIPDITFDGSNTTGQTSDKPFVNFVVRPRQNPGSNYGVSNSPDVTSKQSYATQQTYNVQQFTEIVYTRIRGRQMAFKIESNSVGTQWQLGTPRIDTRPDGRR